MLEKEDLRALRTIMQKMDGFARKDEVEDELTVTCAVLAEHSREIEALKKAQ